MKEHSFGEQILTDTAAKDETGKKSVIDMARNAWGDAPAKTSPHDKSNLAPEGLPSKDTTGAQDATQKAQEASKLEAHKNEQQLAEASHRIKLLNNELHKPGGPLASSALELVGFDKNGRLLLVQRDQTGQVDGKYLVDSESGKIVARTNAGQLDKWEHGPGYKKDGPQTADSKTSDNRSALEARKSNFNVETGATITKDSAGRVHEVTDFHGDKRSYERDPKGNLSEVTITQKGYEPVVYRPGTGVAGVSNHLWYKQPQLEGEPVQGLKFDVKADGTLIQHSSATQFVIYSPDGTITEHRANGQEVITRRGRPDASKDLKPSDLPGPKPGALLA
ncbi:RHS repeat protein [bacterium]|nr:RHS repeat protein [bacterium]MBP9811068.1 RHS repeat protein [bacterium]